MKASELTEGLEVAVVSGASSYDQRTSKASRAQVVEPPSGGHVSVVLLEDANDRLWKRMAWNPSDYPKKGERGRVSTRQCWMPWERIAVRAENEAKAKRQKQEEEDFREAHLRAFQIAVDHLLGDAADRKDLLRWHGIYDKTDHVVIPTKTLEALLAGANPDAKPWLVEWEDGSLEARTRQEAVALAKEVDPTFGNLGAALVPGNEKRKNITIRPNVPAEVEPT